GTSLTWEVCHGALNRANRARTRRPVGALERAKPPLGEESPAGSGNGTTTGSAGGGTSSVVASGATPLPEPVTRAGGLPLRSVTEPSASPVGCTVPSTGGTTSWDTGLLTARRERADRPADVACNRPGGRGSSTPPGVT